LKFSVSEPKKVLGVRDFIGTYIHILGEGDDTTKERKIEGTLSF
jgi:hypothetical protein